MSAKAKSSAAAVATTAKSSCDLNMVTGIAFKVITSILLIPLNKYIYSRYKFPNMILTCIHFVCTFAGVCALRKAGLFEAKRVPIVAMLPMALSFCGFVLLNNLSLEFNTVGVSQHLKVLTMPTVLFISVFFYKKKYPLKIYAAIFLVVCGVYMNSYYDVKFDKAGVIMGLLGVITTSLYQIWIGEKQREFAISSLQLLYYQAPLSAVMLIVLMPAFEKSENLASLVDGSRSLAEWSVIVLSGVVAFLFNWSVYWIIGSTSALTYNIIGNVKFVVVIVIGVLLFDDMPNMQQIGAVVLVFTGLISYSYLRINENNKETTTTEKKTK